jgi:hypothetical protein
VKDVLFGIRAISPLVVALILLVVCVLRQLQPLLAAVMCLRLAAAAATFAPLRVTLPHQKIFCEKSPLWRSRHLTT